MAYIKMSSFYTKRQLEGDEYIVGLDGRNIKMQLEDIKSYLNLSANASYGGVATLGSTPQATGDYFWIAVEPGTYTSYGGVVVPEGSFSIISRSGGIYSVSSTGLLTDMKIEKWEPGTYLQGEQRLHNGELWEVSAVSTSTEPGTGESYNAPWVKVLDYYGSKSTAESLSGESDLILPLDYYMLTGGAWVENSGTTSSLTKIEGGLNVKTLSSALRLIDTKYNFSDDVYAAKGTFEIVGIETATAFVGIAFGENPETMTAMLKGNNGTNTRAYGVNTPTIYFPNSELFEVGDTVTVEIKRTKTGFDVRTGVNGTLSGWQNNAIDLENHPKGNIYITFRNRLEFNVDLEIYRGAFVSKETDVKIDETRDLLEGEIVDIKNQIDTIFIGENIDRLQDTPYPTSSSPNPTNYPIPTPGVVVNQSNDLNGGEIQVIGANAAFTAIDTGYEFPEDILVLKFTVESHTNNPSIGVGYGTPESGEEFKGVAFRQNGQVHGVKLSGSDPINLTAWASRTANPEYVFTVGDEILMEIDIKSQTLSISVNGVKQPILNNTEEITPYGNVFIYIRAGAHIKNVLLATRKSTNEEDTSEIVTFYVSKTGSDSNNGSSTSPFITINKAILELSEHKSGKIIVSEGDYRESLDLGLLPNGNFSIENREGHMVRILGSNQLTGWSKTGGRTNVYQAEFSGTVPAWSRHANPIFEDGRPSKPIASGEEHPLQKNLTHRLPFTDILQVSSIDQVDTTPGSYFLDSGIIYIHTSDSDDPSTNGHRYEVISRAANSINAAATTAKKVDLKLKGLQFMYTTTGLRLTGFNDVELNFVVSLGSSGAGAICPNTGNNKLYYCEAGFCNGDGFNGHFSAYSGYASLLDNRSNYPTTKYIGCWAHDNFDDGESSHEQHNVFMDSCLLEYNGDSGCRPSNDATYYVKDSIFRHNGWEVGHGGSAGKGEGFAVVNPSINPNRVGCRAILFNCLSHDNNTGYGTISSAENKIELINCTSRNNSSAEYYAGIGIMILRNCKATNSDPAKIKVTDTGTITTQNDTEVS